MVHHSGFTMPQTATTEDAMRKGTKTVVTSDRANLTRKPVKKLRELAEMAQLQAAAPRRAPAAMRVSIDARLSMTVSRALDDRFQSSQ